WAAMPVLADAVEDDVEPARQNAREVFAFIIDRRGPEFADQRCVRAARGAPQLEAGQSAEHEQRLTDGASGSLHEHALSSLNSGRAMKELARGRPAQDQRGRLR